MIVYPYSGTILLPGECMKIFKITKDLDAMSVYFHFNGSQIATMRAAMGFDKVSKRPIITDWNLDLQVATISLLNTQDFNEYTNAIHRIKTYAERLVALHRNEDINNFLNLEIKQEETIL